VVKSQIKNREMADETKKPWWEMDDEDDQNSKGTGIDEIYQEVHLASKRFMEAATSVVLDSAGIGNEFIRIN
jgi:hypothetical protein